ncbi:MAG TPA: TylF/MycF/NovP-related O-methyltransferase [Oculatellaceae cyanobacterium]
MKRTEFDAPVTEMHGMGSEKDAAHWSALENILEKYPHSVGHLLSHWPVYTRRINLLRFLAHFKLFEKTIDLPGDIIEIGVARGVSLFSWHKFIEIFHSNDTAKKIIGIDSFEGLRDFSEKDGAHDIKVSKTDGGFYGSSVEGEIEMLAAWHNNDNILAKQRVILKKGRVEDVLGPLLSERPGLRISLLHMDVDLYEPTLFALRNLWDLVVPGGVIVFDEYGLPPWAGEGTAVDEFIRERSLSNIRIQKFPWSLTPNGFIVKP